MEDVEDWKIFANFLFKYKYPEQFKNNCSEVEDAENWKIFANHFLKQDSPELFKNNWSWWKM